MKKNSFLLFSLFLLFIAFAFRTLQPADNTPRSKTMKLPAHPQRTGGDAEKGWEYLRYGNYIGAGVPYSIYKRTLKKSPKLNELNRTGKSADLPRGFNLFEDKGVEIVAGINCFGCHSATINGEFIAGVGDYGSNFATSENSKFFKRLETFVKLRYGKKSTEYQAYLPLARGSEYVSPYTVTPFIGVNPAFKLEEAAVAHRHASDLSWADGKQVFPLTKEVYGSDVPPLWNVKKKNALYYNAMGRGDFSKLLMQVMVVAIDDSTEARTINNQFDDVLAWLNNLEAPKYPRPVDTKLAEKGQALFEDNCSKCHGYYSADGSEDSYPNLLVGIDVVKTDSVYAHYAYQNKNFTNWLNSSWIMTSAPKAWVQPELAYIAPPLDGVWATAPYLHNGSVPTLEDLLNSSARPTYFRRAFEAKGMDYDFEKVGWQYTAETAGKDIQTYNTTLKGYGNGGHTFGDKFTASERKAIIEYLKTL